MSKKCLCIFGEVLFDHFPDGNRILGGAPFNVAWHLQAFGQKPCFISRVGTDPEGDEIVSAMKNWGMRTDALQIDSTLPTGRVDVSFNNGEPSYDIAEPCAYDAIEAEKLNIDCNLLYHGSLALRNSASRLTIETLRSPKPDIVFIDINLRPPWWQLSYIQKMIHDADWVKLNNDELDELDNSTKDSTTKGKELVKEYGLKGLLITHGSAGAEVITANGAQATIKPENNTTVVDTVGAGDAFASVIIMGLSNNWPLEITLSRAQDFASGIVANQGATISNKNFYQRYIEQWGNQS